MSLPEWNDLIAGKDCPFCAPQEDVDGHSFKVADLDVSTLRLSREQIYRGYCTLIFNKRHTNGIDRLTDDEFTRYQNDLRRAAKAIISAVKPDLMNYATLGNAIPHTHYHIIPRFKTDPRWGQAIWRRDFELTPVLLKDEEYKALVRDIRAGL